MIIVSNTSPLNNLAAIGRLDLLQQLYNRLTIPNAVDRELLAAGTTDRAVLAVQAHDWIQIQPVTDLSLLQTLQTKLDAGEAEAIALACRVKCRSTHY